jgi:hypothetical protein
MWLLMLHSLLNPFFLFVLICLGGFWLYMSSATANESPENPTKIMGRTVTPDQRKLGMLGGMLACLEGLLEISSLMGFTFLAVITVSAAVIVVFGGSILFTICSARYVFPIRQFAWMSELTGGTSFLLSAAHSLFRTLFCATAPLSARRTSWDSCRARLTRSRTRSNRGWDVPSSQTDI